MFCMFSHVENNLKIKQPKGKEAHKTILKAKEYEKGKCTENCKSSVLSHNEVRYIICWNNTKAGYVS